MHTGFMNKFLEVRGAAWAAGVLAGAVIFLSMMAGVALAGPTNLSLPTISPPGTLQEGATLNGTQGQWQDATGTPTIQDQWESCSAGTCSPVGTLDSLSYAVTSTDVGHTIVLSETATDAALVPPDTTVASAATSAVLPLPPAASTPAPLVSGTAQQSVTLSAVHGGWTNTPTSYSDV
jgi:hypothetical protein